MLNSTPSAPIAECSADRPDMQVLASLLKACGDPLRVQILRVMSSDTFGVLELTQLFETKQSGMSHHLKVLSNLGLLETQREGNAIFYRRPFAIDDPSKQRATSTLYSLIDAYPIDKELETGLDAIRHQRGEQSKAFFEKQSENSTTHQEMIARYEQYAPASLDMLKSAKLDAGATVVELGPGNGQFLMSLARHFNNLVAIDTSEVMLERASQLAQKEGLHNVDLICGDSSELAKVQRKKDAIVMNMVLHHVPHPFQVFKDCSEALRKEGALVICDLVHHDQNWAKENCGDLWLGFSPEQLEKWGEQANLELKDSVFIGLRNGFQVQCLKFEKA